jgi:hypothetical protein
MLNALAKDQSNHGEPANDPAFDTLVTYTIEHGVPFDQGNNNWRLSVQFTQGKRACHDGDWGFRVVVATNAPPFPPRSWRSDGMPVGVITAFRMHDGPPAVSFPMNHSSRRPVVAVSSVRGTDAR